MRRRWMRRWFARRRRTMLRRFWLFSRFRRWLCCRVCRRFFCVLARRRWTLRTRRWLFGWTFRGFWLLSRMFSRCRMRSRFRRRLCRGLLSRMLRRGWFLARLCSLRCLRVGLRGYRLRLRFIVNWRRLRPYHARLEISRLGRRRNWRPALVYRRAQFRVLRSFFTMLHLSLRRFHMLLRGERAFLGGWLTRNAARPVVAHSIHSGLVDHRAINIRRVDHRGIHVHNGSVVHKVAAVPPSTDKSFAPVSISVIDSAGKAYVWAPIPGVPPIHAPCKTPIAGRPQKSGLRRHNPRARHPVITSIIRARPIPRGPQISFARADRLLIHRNCRRRKSYRYAYGDLRMR